MRVYKSSGIEYLGEIPKHWEICKLNKISYFINGYAFESSHFDYSFSIPVIRIGDIQNDKIIYHTCLMTKEQENLKNFMIYRGDIVIALSGATTGKFAVCNSNKKAYINQRVAIIRSDIKILKYYLSTFGFVNYIDMLCNGSAQPNISTKEVGNFKIPLPPLQEQKEIAEFLDKKCEKIQNYINKKQKLITLLQEKKQALINEAVTKGLNPNIEFKNSGIEYLGLIPHHWEVTNLKNIVSIKSGGTPSRDNKDYWNGDIPWIRSEFCHNQHIFQCDVKEKITTLGLQKSSAKMCEKNTILIALVGATIGQVAFLNFKSAINQNIAAIYPNNAAILDNVFLFFVALTFKQRFEILGKYAIANLAFIGNLKIPLPPLQEQKEIAEFLDKKCEKINSAIEKTKKQIELVREYKNTLINEAVCGRIKLRK